MTVIDARRKALPCPGRRPANGNGRSDLHKHGQTTPCGFGPHVGRERWWCERCDYVSAPVDRGDRPEEFA